MVDPTYRIVNWSATYENNRTKDIVNLQWVPIPNRMDGDGYTELLDHENGAAHFGAFVALVEIASRCFPRGTLIRDGGIPHTPATLSRVSRMKVRVFEEMIPRAISIGWLEACDIPQEGAAIPQEGAASRVCAGARGMEWNGRNGRNGRNGMEGIPPAAEKKPPATQTDIGNAVDDAFRGITLPPTFDTPEFRQALADWKGHILALTGRELSVFAEREIYQKVTPWGPARAIAAIRNSMAGSSKTIYEEREKKSERGQFSDAKLDEILDRTGKYHD